MVGGVDAKEKEDLMIIFYADWPGPVMGSCQGTLVLDTRAVSFHKGRLS